MKKGQLTDDLLGVHRIGYFVIDRDADFQPLQPLSRKEIRSGEAPVVDRAFTGEL